MLRVRNKPWYRPRNVALALLAALLVFAGWVVLETLKVSRARPRPSIDSRAELRRVMLSRSGVAGAEADAQWLLLESVFDELDAVEVEINALLAGGAFGPADQSALMLDYGSAAAPDASATDRAAVARALELLAERGVFERLDEFAAGPPALRPARGEGPLSIESLLDDLGRARRLAQALGAAMHLRSAGGDLAGAARAFEHAMALGRTVAWQPYLLGSLTAMAIERLAAHRLRALLAAHELDEAACRSLLASFERHAWPPVGYAVEAEEIYWYEWLQWSYSDDGEGGGYLVSAPVPGATPAGAPGPSLPEALWARFFGPTRDELTAVYVDVVERLHAASRMSGLERARALKEIAAVSDEHVLVAGGAFAKCIENYLVEQVLAEGARVLVALEAFHARHGRWPEALDALAPDVVPEAPADPLHGGPFGYRLLAGDPHGRPYLLYSTGLDGTDDGGRRHGEGDPYAALRDPGLAGVDFVINRPPEPR